MNSIVVTAETCEHIHRSNRVMIGILRHGGFVSIVLR